MEGCAAARTEATRAANRDGGAKRRGELFAITKPRASTLRLGRRPKADQPRRFDSRGRVFRRAARQRSQNRLDFSPPVRHHTFAPGSGTMADDDGLISGLTEDQLITNEEMDALVKEVRRADVHARSRVVPSSRPRSGTAARPPELVSDASRPPPPPPVRTRSGDRVDGRHEQLHAHEGQPVDDERGGARDRPSASRSRKCIVVFGTAERSRRA